MMVMGLAGCGKKDSADSSTQAQSEIVYAPEFTQYEYTIDTKGETFPSLYGMYMNGDMLYMISRSYVGQGSIRDNLNTLNLVTGEKEVRGLGGTAQYDRTQDGYVSYTDKKLIVYDENFEVTGEIDVAAFVNELLSQGSFYSFDSMTMDAEGNIGLVASNILYLLDSSGVQRAKAECPGNMNKIDKVFVTGSGQWYVLCRDMEYKNAICPVDIRGGVIGGQLENVPNKSGSIVYDIYPLEDNQFFILTRSYLERYNADTQTCDEVFCMSDYGIAVEQWSTGIGMLSGNNPGIINVTNASTASMREENADYKELELVRLAEAEPGAAGRTELILACIDEPAYNEREPIMKFNKYNPDYYITIKAYSDMDYNTDDRTEIYDLALQNFNNDLVTGAGVDIFFAWAGYMDLDNLGDKGALVDMYELIDADDEISRDDFIQSVLKAMENDGRLYKVTADFRVDTIVGKKSLLDKYETWDFDAIYDLAMEHPDAALFPNSTREGILNSFLGFSMDVFYDKDKAECSFDSEQFVKLLELAKAAPENYDSSIEMGEVLTNEKALLYDKNILFWYDTQIMPKYFGEDISYVGYPSAEGNSSGIECSYMWALSAKSEHRDAAWSFIKSLFEDEYQRSGYKFPVMKASFENLLAEKMHSSENGSAYIGNNVDVALHAMTETEAEELRELVDGAKLSYRYNTTIKDIVLEEAQAFFAGSRSAEDTAAIIQDRVQIYLEENN